MEMITKESLAEELDKVREQITKFLEGLEHIPGGQEVIDEFLIFENGIQELIGQNHE